MAKKCMLRRENARAKCIEEYAKRRGELKKIISNPASSVKDRVEAQMSLQKLPRNSSKVRANNRCWITGRAKGVYRFVGMCRNMFRIHAMQGDIPGLHKASW